MMLSGISKPNPCPKLPIGQEPDRSQPMASVGQISMPGWPPYGHGRCSPLALCQVSHLAQVCNAHSQLSSGQATGLAHADIGNPVAVGPINTSPGVHETSDNSESPIGTPLVLGKAPYLAQTISSPLQLSPSKFSGLTINSPTTCPPPATDVGDSILIPDPNHYSVGIPHFNWDEVEKQFLNVQYEISCISKALNRLCQREFEDIASVSPNVAGEDYPGSNTQVEVSPAKDVCC